MTKQELKELLKGSLTVESRTVDQFFAGRDGCMGYHALVTKTTVKFDGDVISETQNRA